MTLPNHPSMRYGMQVPGFPATFRQPQITNKTSQTIIYGIFVLNCLMIMILMFNLLTDMIGKDRRIDE
jgi:hypothetical protein